jgi:hypothetical protein
MARNDDFPARKRGGHLCGASDRRRQGRSAGVPDVSGQGLVFQIALRRLT